MFMYPIETPRLRLRPFLPEDWQEIYVYTSDARVMTFIPEGQMTEDQTQQFVTANSGDQAEAFPVILKSENRPIGHMNFHPWFATRIYEIGWVFHSAYHSNGYATEAAQALLRYGFEDLAVHRVIATCQPENIASWRVMEKLGMKREGHLRKCIDRGENVWWDEYFYAILEEEWFDQQANISP